MGSSKGSFFASSTERSRLQGSPRNANVIRVRASSNLMLPPQYSAPSDDNHDDGKRGLRTAAILCMSIFIPIGAGLIMCSGYKYGWRRAETKYSKVNVSQNL